jgi:serine/threonine-protein kinase
VQRLSAALADRYAIERELGAGGMATVYLAHDVRHDRKVALKVLRPELSAILGAERFLHEIKTTANLQHPHILSLFDSGEADGLVYYVMPYVEGESLRDRLAREKQLPVEDAVRIAREVADALHYAHEHGIVHRDIKPENILLHGGHAMVADFGIALAASRSEGSTRMTETGMSLGTPYYMSPEQSMGEREITPKADIYALGCVLYEMLTAEPPFTGATAQAIIARVMTEEPRSLTLQRKSIPPHIEAAVERALEKLPADRWASAAEFGAALADAGARGHGGTDARKRRAVLLATVSGLALGALGLAAGWAIWHPRPSTVAPVVLRYAMSLPDSAAASGVSGASVAYAPDGTAFAYVSRVGLMLRSADRAEVLPVPGGRRGVGPFFSPDSRWLGYQDGSRLMRMPLSGGAAVSICDSCLGYEFDWGTDDTIRFHTSPPENVNMRVLMAVSARGGKAHEIAHPDSATGELYRSPMLLPGRRTVLFAIFNGAASRLGALDLNSGVVTRFDQPGFSPNWVDAGFVVLGNADGSILALPFDPDKVRITGAPVTIARDGVADGFSLKAGVSRTGSLVYERSGAVSHRQLMLVSRSGQASPLSTEPRGFAGPRFAPDGRRIAMHINGENGVERDVWLLDIAQRAWSRLTTNGVSDRPIWMPDGGRIVYSSNEDIWWVVADGSGRPDSLLTAVGSRQPGSVTPDGRTLIFQETGSGQAGIRSMVFDSAPAARMIIPQAFGESAPALSPDGHWLAYQSDEAGRMEVYVRPWPEAGARVPVSVRGGSEPAWSREGRELFYRSGDSLMSAAVSLAPSFAVTTRRTLFAGRYLSSPEFREYDVSPDGQRFVMVTGSTESSTLIAMHNVFDRLAYDRRQRP